MIEEERRSGRPDEPPGPFFDSIFVRGAMAWAREKGFEERLEMQEDGVPIKRYFGPVPLRLAMAFARETALDEAAHIAPREADLFYAISPATHGVVFARPERARYVSSLHKAMNAKTWGK